MEIKYGELSGIKVLSIAKQNRKKAETCLLLSLLLSSTCFHLTMANPRKAPKLEEGHKGSLEQLTDKALHKIHCRKYSKNLAKRSPQWLKRK